MSVRCISLQAVYRQIYRSESGVSVDVSVGAQCTVSRISVVGYSIGQMNESEDSVSVICISRKTASRSDASVGGQCIGQICI